MKVKIEGFAELEKALAEELPRATAVSVLTRTATNASKRILTKMAQLAPKESGDLAGSMRTQKVKAKRAKGGRYERRSGVEVITGPAPRGKLNRANAAWQEFGTVEMPANAYARPAADAEAQAVIGEVRDELAAQIDKAKARIAKRALKAKG